MEDKTEDLTVQSSKDRQIELTGRKVLRKRNSIQKKKLSDTQCECNISTVAACLLILGIFLIRKYIAS